MTIYYHDLSSSFAANEGIKELCDEVWDAGDKGASENRPPLQSLMRTPHTAEPWQVGTARWILLRKSAWEKSKSNSVTETIEVVELDDIASASISPEKQACSNFGARRVGYHSERMVLLKMSPTIYRPWNVLVINPLVLIGSWRYGIQEGTDINNNTGTCGSFWFPW